MIITAVECSVCKQMVVFPDRYFSHLPAWIHGECGHSFAVTLCTRVERILEGAKEV